MLFVARYVRTVHDPVKCVDRSRVRDVGMHMERSRCVIHGKKTSSCITCLSRYFPESVCTAVYGVGYSLSLYYLLLLLLTMSMYCGSCSVGLVGSSRLIRSVGHPFNWPHFHILLLFNSLAESRLLFHSEA